ncbi:MAG: hypothetical protein IJP69_09080 [Synergistaceae bacterium]|nr:hypothetical protein [Synergistaceae bacterium]
MKIRSDFVTNSSSSNFIFSFRGEITSEQKMSIPERVLGKIFKNLLLTPGATDDDIKKIAKDYEFDDDENAQERIKQALAEGKDIYCGAGACDECYGGCAVREIWEELEEVCEIDELVSGIYTWLPNKRS